MRLERKKYVLDIQQAAALASEFVAGRTCQDYQATAMLRAAVERQCEIIGEALAKLAKAMPKTGAADSRPHTRADSRRS